MPPTRLSTSGMNHNSQPESVTALWLVLITRPAEDRRLSWPGLLSEILRWYARTNTVTHASILSRRPGIDPATVESRVQRHNHL